VFAVVGAIMGVCAIHAIWASFRKEGRGVPLVMATHAAVIFVISALMVFPAMNPYKSARFFCAPLRELAQRGTDYDLYSVGFSREEYVYYADHFHTPVLCELLNIPEMAELSFLKQARLQSKMQRTIQKAVRDVPVASLGAVTDAEVESLRKAVEDAMAPELKTDSLGLSYENAVTKRLRQLFQGMDSPAPSYMMVQEEDWRWILALCPEARQYTLVGQRNVGSRATILMANTPGVTALGAT